MNIYQKLIEVRKCVPYLQKGADGPQFKYVSSSQVLASCKAKMDELQLLLIPRVTNHNLLESTVENKDIDKFTKVEKIKKTTTYFTELDVEFTWINAEKPDETIICSWYGQGVDIAGEKGVGKALTYAEKYFMLKFFNIPTDKDDPDAFQEKHNGEPTKPEPKQPAPTTPKTPSKPKENKTGQVISDSQRTRMFALAKSNQDIVKDIISIYKYESTKDIKTTDYEAICNEIEKVIKATEGASE